MISQPTQVIKMGLPALLVLALLLVSVGNQSLSAKPSGGLSLNPESPNLVGKKTVDLVKEFEGYYPRCLDWLDGHATIGHGYLIHFGPCTAKDNRLYWSREKSARQLRKDLFYFQKRVNQLVKVKMTKNMLAALTSFSYNVGVNGLKYSTLLELLNNNQYRAAAGQFDLWINGPDGPLPGLVKRRAIEKELFLKGHQKLLDN